MHTSFGGRPAWIKMASLFNGRSATETKIVRNRGSSKCLYLSRFSRCVNLIGLDRVIQYAAASRSITIVSGILGRPAKPGDEDLLQSKDSKTARPSAPAARSGAARRRRSRNR